MSQNLNSPCRVVVLQAKNNYIFTKKNNYMTKIRAVDELSHERHVFDHYKAWVTFWSYFSELP